MDERVVTLAVALVCLFVVGSAAGSLESAVESSPSEAIDLDYASLPLDRGQAYDIKREYQKLTQSPDGQPEQSSQASERGADTRDQQSGGGGDDATASSSSTTTESKTGTGGEKDILEQLLDALLALLSRLAAFFVAAVVFVGAALAFRYRDRISERLAPYLARFGGSDPERQGSADVVPPATPQNEVTEAWYEMVQHVRLDEERPLTPRERASLARERGADANTVWSLTELFEEVQYGGAPVTEERRERARQYLDRFRRINGGNES